MVDGIIGGYMGITFISASFFVQDFTCVAIGRDSQSPVTIQLVLGFKRMLFPGTQ
jgi:hypothetical protein